MNTNPEKVMYEIRIFFEIHQKKILGELKERGIGISLENIPKILKFTSFHSRSKNHNDSCRCYKGDNPRPCHNNIPLEEFSCFLCGCPNYQSDSDTGGCRINSSEGIRIPFPPSPKGILWDCSLCSYPHREEVVKRYIRDHLAELKKLYDSI